MVNSTEGWTTISLTVDNYEGNRNNALETKRPTRKDVIDGVKSLNGASKSSMAIVGSDNSVLAVGGGPKNYSVQVTHADSKVFVLCDPKKSAHQENIVIGSVRTPLPANLIVDEEMTMEAVEEFFSHGTLASSLKWVES